MPIRVKGKLNRRARLAASLENWSGTIAGTFAAANVISGRLQSQLYDWTGVITGRSMLSANVSGVITAQLEH